MKGDEVRVARVEVGARGDVDGAVGSDRRCDVDPGPLSTTRDEIGGGYDPCLPGWQRPDDEPRAGSRRRIAAHDVPVHGSRRVDRDAAADVPVHVDRGERIDSTDRLPCALQYL